MLESAGAVIAASRHIAQDDKRELVASLLKRNARHAAAARRGTATERSVHVVIPAKMQRAEVQSHMTLQ